MEDTVPLANQKIENMELLLEVGRLLSSKLELPDLLHSIMPLAARVVNADRASLLLVDPHTEELYFDVALGLPPEVAQIRLKMGQGIAGTVARQKKPIVINDAKSDPRWFSKTDKKSGYVTRSIIAVPLVLRGKCIGVVEGINRLEGEFTLTDLRVFEAFASQAAVAIDNARLFASLNEERLKLDTLLNEMRDAAILTDSNGGILFANESAKRYFTAAEPGTWLKDAVADMNLTPPLGEIIGSDKPVVSFEAERDEPKKLVLAGTASLIHTPFGDVQGRVMVFRNITSEKYEEGLKRSFLSLISHKLKTPLSSITGYSQLLLQEFKGNKEAERTCRSLAAINTQGSKLNDLVEKLLNYTVIEGIGAVKVEKNPFEVDALLRDAILAMESRLKECKAAAEIRDTSGLRVIGDPQLLRDALKNVIDNGIKFSRSGGAKIALWARRAGDEVEICVQDDGPGIPPEEIENIFNRFHQVEASFTGQIEGWGLGLSFVRKVTERLDGTVRAESKLGSGSTIILKLPAPKS